MYYPFFRQTVGYQFDIMFQNRWLSAIRLPVFFFFFFLRSDDRLPTMVSRVPRLAEHLRSIADNAKQGWLVPGMQGDREKLYHTEMIR